jgi:hypothetical protein
MSDLVTDLRTGKFPREENAGLTAKKAKIAFAEMLIGLRDADGVLEKTFFDWGVVQRRANFDRNWGEQVRARVDAVFNFILWAQENDAEVRGLARELEKAKKERARIDAEQAAREAR